MQLFDNSYRGPEAADVFSRIRYEPKHELRAAVEATGNKIEDIKTVIIGHLHIDHAGGLEEFLDAKDVSMYVVSFANDCVFKARALRLVPSLTNTVF